MTAKGRSRSDALFPIIVLLSKSRIPYTGTHLAPAWSRAHSMSWVGEDMDQSIQMALAPVWVSLYPASVSHRAGSVAPVTCLPALCSLHPKHRWSPSLCPGESAMKQAKLKMASFLVHADTLLDAFCAFAQQGLKNPHVYFLTYPAWILSTFSMPGTVLGVGR